MPRKNPEDNAKYQRERQARLRAEWFADNPCIDCGATENLQVDHIDRSTKVTHRIWNWSEVRRNAELEKCVSRCVPCHRKKTIKNGEYNAHAKTKLTAEQVKEIRNRTSESYDALALEFGVSSRTIHQIWSGRNMAKRVECSACGEQKVPVIYGFPSSSMISKAKRGEIVLGGCVIQPGAKRYVCSCDYPLAD